jgi:succinoglycan biosynthesis protein ExoU
MTQVGVLIAAKDAAATIGRAVASALAQPQVTEVIVVDDGSADDTAARALRHDDGTGRVRVRRMPDSGGPAAARNLALALATAPVVAILDADDHFLPGRIAALLAAGGADWDFLADGLLMVPDGAPLAAARRQDVRARVGADMLSLETFIAGCMPRPRQTRQELGFMKPLIRRDFLDRTGLRYDPGLRLGEDTALYARALLHGARFRLVPGCFYVAVRRADSLSGSHGAADLANLARASFDLARLPGLTPSQRAALLRHAVSVLRRADYRAALDLKQQRRFLRLAAFLSSNLRSVPYMIRQSARARFATEA